MATFGYTWLLLLAMCTGYNGAPTETTSKVQLLDDRLAALYYGSNSSDARTAIDPTSTSTPPTATSDPKTTTTEPHNTSTASSTTTEPISIHKDCQDAYSKGLTKSDVYKINPDGQTQMEVLCDQESSNGGWTVIQRRLDGMVDFDRTWSDYKHGFGNAAGDYYLGNDNINLLTTSTDQKLRVELHHQGHGFAYAEYSVFMVGDEEQKYQLHIGGYTATNSPGDSLTYHNGQFFSTRDQDNDQDGGHCSHQYSSGWWFKNCSNANLNGVYASTCDKGITWTTWLGSTTSLTSVKMMVKPVDGDAEATTTRSTSTPTTNPDTTRPTTIPTLTTTEHVETTSTMPTSKDCQDVYDNGGKTSGVYSIYPDGKREVQVYCDQTIADGGWLVFQRQVDGSETFYRGWDEYKQGFGRATGDYWLGNDNIYALTKNRNQKLKVVLHYGDDVMYADYAAFWIGHEDDKYELYVSGHSGTDPPGDSLTFQKGQSFSTKDQDNDDHYSRHCAQLLSGGWWYERCIYDEANLNGVYGDEYFIWPDYNEQLTGTTMMVKRK